MNALYGALIGLGAYIVGLLICIALTRPPRPNPESNATDDQRVIQIVRASDWGHLT